MKASSTSALLLLYLSILLCNSPVDSSSPPHSWPAGSSSDFSSYPSSCHCTASQNAGCWCVLLGQYDPKNEQMQYDLSSMEWQPGAQLKSMAVISQGDVNGVSCVGSNTYIVGFNSGFLTENFISLPVSKVSGNFRVCMQGGVASRSINNLAMNGYGNYGTNDGCTIYQTLNVHCTGDYQLEGVNAVVDQTTFHPFAFQFYFVGTNGGCFDSGATFQNVFPSSDSSDPPSSSGLSSASARTVLIVLVTILPVLFLLLLFLFCYFRRSLSNQQSSSTSPRAQPSAYSSAAAAAAASAIVSDTSVIDGVEGMPAAATAAVAIPMPMSYSAQIAPPVYPGLERIVEGRAAMNGGLGVSRKEEGERVYPNVELGSLRLGNATSSMVVINYDHEREGEARIAIRSYEQT